MRETLSLQSRISGTVYVGQTAEVLVGVVEDDVIYQIGIGHSPRRSDHDRQPWPINTTGHAHREPRLVAAAATGRTTSRPTTAILILSNRKYVVHITACTGRSYKRNTNANQYIKLGKYV